jgi:glycosyltransferase involved in cell wall biosynthesis
MLVTFALMCHDQRPFIREALRAAFPQDYQPLEILVADDHSTDGTFDIVREEVENYRGPHTVRVMRHEKNIGFENWFRTAEAARGEFVVGAHGDDVSCPERTTCLVEAWQKTGASLLGSNAEIIDADSRVVGLVHDADDGADWLAAARLAKRGYDSRMNGATLAWRPDVFRRFAPLTAARLGAAYDHVLPFRAALLRGSYYTPQRLVRWRVHGKNAGNESADRTRGRWVKRETSFAYKLGARICMLDDLDYFIAQQAQVTQAQVTHAQDTTDLAELREQLVAQILVLARSFSHKRNQLMAWGRRPSWTSRQEIEGRPEYGKGYGPATDPGPRRISAKTVRRWLAKILKGSGR